MAEIYVSTDIETDGFMPGENSMLSLGSAAYLSDGRLLGTWSANFETLPGAGMDPSTAQFWAQQPLAWEVCRRDLRAPAQAMPEYAAWLRALPGRPVFVGYPVTFDFMFVGWYLVRFARDNPFGFSAIDISSFAMAVLGREFRQTTKHHMPREWFDPTLPHTHVALDDALEQGALFMNLLAASRRREATGA
ncbi:MAG: 3'-5' exonuclease [Immundisolibacter sp.]|uniref:3'-5' exonuclease n=1 Tax=Immundisolibacter sp. TaxID=1934948 RepID=UPI003EE0F88A